MTNVSELFPDIFVISDLESANAERSWLPAKASGFEPFNKYLVRNEDNLLLIDTGVAAHRQSVLAGVKLLLGRRALSIIITRSEQECIGNLGAIADAYPALRVLTAAKNLPILGTVHRACDNEVEVHRVDRGRSLADVGFPAIQLIEPFIRTLSTVWLVEQATGTLFSSDFFTADLLGSADESLVRTDLMGFPSAATVRRHIYCKFDWIERATLPRLMVKWESCFSRCHPSNIAPGLGRPQAGRDHVNQVIEHYKSAIFGGSTSH